LPDEGAESTAAAEAACLADEVAAGSGMPPRKADSPPLLDLPPEPTDRF
jgi:hypothetical protein